MGRVETNKNDKVLYRIHSFINVLVYTCLLYTSLSGFLHCSFRQQQRHHESTICWWKHHEWLLSHCHLAMSAQSPDPPTAELRNTADIPCDRCLQISYTLITYYIFFKSSHILITNTILQNNKQSRK